MMATDAFYMELRCLLISVASTLLLSSKKHFISDLKNTSF